MLSLTSEYALRAVLYLADHGGGESLRVEPMANALGLPRNYLSKTLNQLAKRGVLASQRGPTGGFRLAVPAAALTLAQIVETFDPKPIRPGCLLGQPHCSDLAPCPAHERWSGIAESVASFFRDTTVKDLLDDRAPEPVEAEAVPDYDRTFGAPAAVLAAAPILPVSG